MITNECRVPVYHDYLFSVLRSVSIDKWVGAQIANRSVNQPLGRNQAFVCVGPGGIKNQDASPTAKVRQPSIMNMYRQPANPPTPLKRKIPVARNALTRLAT